MATTSLLAGLDLTKWREDFIREYVRDTGFSPYMGDAPTDIIHMVNDLKTSGYTIRIPLVGRLQSAGVTGNQRLSGNEEGLDQYYQDISWEFRRHAIEFSKKDREKSAADLVRLARPLLKEWSAEQVKYNIISTLHTMSDGTAYADASSTVRNTFLTNNSDRVQFGALVSNYSSGVMATALGTVDSSADKLTASVAQMAKRRARLARPIIRPFKTGTQGREFYVMFCHPHCFRDLKNDTTITAANRDARPRDVDSNPLFQDGDLIYDGIIFREIPEFYQAKQGTGVNTNTHLAGVGGSSIDVGVNFLCGAQSIGYVNKQAAAPTEKKEDDYGFFTGMGIEFADGFSKLRWNNNTAGANNGKDVGVYTLYCSAVGDT